MSSRNLFDKLSQEGKLKRQNYEFHNYKRTDFPLFDPLCRFTDDTVLTVAVADCLLHGSNYAAKFKEYFRLYPGRGYGVRFRRWAASERALPYRSTGNGSAMRVSPVGFAFSSLEAVLDEARKSAEVTHNTEEGIAGGIAQAYYGKIPRAVEKKVLAILDERLREIVLEFMAKYPG
jgi:ADP-ribosylglycohydrolase